MFKGSYISCASLIALLLSGAAFADSTDSSIQMLPPTLPNSLTVCSNGSTSGGVQINHVLAYSGNTAGGINCMPLTADTAGNLVAGGNVTADNNLIVDGGATIGSSCSQTGLIAQNGNGSGTLLSCQLNNKVLTWQLATGATPQYSSTCLDYSANGWTSFWSCMQDGHPHLVYSNDSNGNSLAIDNNNDYGTVSTVSAALSAGFHLRISTYGPNNTLPPGGPSTATVEECSDGWADASSGYLGCAGQIHIGKDGSGYASGFGVNLFTNEKLVHNNGKDSATLTDISVGLGVTNAETQNPGPVEIAAGPPAYTSYAFRSWYVQF